MYLAPRVVKKYDWFVTVQVISLKLHTYDNDRRGGFGIKLPTGMWRAQHGGQGT